MFKYLIIILLTATTTVSSNEKKVTEGNIENPTKEKLITFSERAYFTNTDDFSGNKFSFNEKESFKYDYVNLHHPFSTSSPHFRSRFIAKFKLIEKVSAVHVDEINQHFRSKAKGVKPVIYFEVTELNEPSSKVSGEVKIIGYGWLNAEERRNKLSNTENIKWSYFTEETFTLLK